MPKKDLRQMKKDKQVSRVSKQEISEAAKKFNVDPSQIEEDSIASVEETIAQYENKNEDELMNDLERVITQGRKDGSFTDDMLDGFIQNVAPMLDDAQRQKLQSIAQMIKMNKI